MRLPNSMSNRGIAVAESEYRAALSTFEVARSALQHEDAQLPFVTNAARIYDDYINFLVAQGKVDQALKWRTTAARELSRKGWGGCAGGLVYARVFEWAAAGAKDRANNSLLLAGAETISGRLLQEDNDCAACACF